MGESSSSFPCPGGGHRDRTQPIGMNTKPSLGTGFAGVWAHAVEAGIIASSSGSARAACALFRNVRRGMDFFVRNIAFSLLPCAHLVISCFAGDSCHFRAPHLK